MRLRRVLLDSVVLLLLLLLAWIAVPTFTRRPWDLETYLLAAKAVLAGLDPYVPGNLEIIAARPVGMLFFYPPITIPLFVPFAHMPLPAATALWLALKVIGSLVVFQLWRRHFLPQVALLPLAMAAAFAFNGSLIWDLRTGNVMVLQDLLLWTGFAFLVQGRQAMAAVSILAGAVFKLSPALFLALLVLPTKGSRPAWRVVAVCVAMFAAALILPLAKFAWAPWQWHGLAFAGPWGMANPSVLCLVNSLRIRSQGAAYSEAANFSIWVGYVIALILISVAPVRQAWARQDRRLWIFTLTAMFVLLSPRPVAYGYFLAVPSMLFLLGGRGGTVWLVSLGISAQAIVGAVVEYRDPWATNLAFITLFISWVIYAGICAADRKVDHNTPPASTC